ncbi:MAG: hypothetical protein R3B60_03230 [Candidatus Paceibacterota bacterium]
MKTKHYLESTFYALVATIVTLALISMSFFLAEPKVGLAVDSGPFTVKQVIGDEISFLVEAASTTLTGPINGITGGTGNGTTTAVVRSNSATGYTMSIAFANNTTDNAMLGDATASESIHDMPATSSEPVFTFDTSSSSAVFGYTVSADNSSDLDDSFKDNGSACNTGSGYTYDRCWMEPQVSGFQIINRTTSTDSATTTINFRVYVPNSPSPSLVADTYTATATLTAVNQ